MSDAKQVTVIVTASNHSHAGKPVAKGARLSVDAATAKWLTTHKLAAPAPSAAADTTPTKESK